MIETINIITHKKGGRQEPKNWRLESNKYYLNYVACLYVVNLLKLVGLSTNLSRELINRTHTKHGRLKQRIVCMRLLGSAFVINNRIVHYNEVSKHTISPFYLLLLLLLLSFYYYCLLHIISVELMHAVVVCCLCQ